MLPIVPVLRVGVNVERWPVAEVYRTFETLQQTEKRQHKNCRSIAGVKLTTSMLPVEQWLRQSRSISVLLEQIFLPLPVFATSFKLSRI